MDLEKLARKHGFVNVFGEIDGRDELAALVNEVLEEAAKHILSQSDMGSEYDEVERCADQIRSLKLT